MNELELPAGALKLLQALRMLRVQAGTEVFPASLNTLFAVSKLSRPTITTHRQLLTHKGYLQQVEPGYYRLTVPETKKPKRVKVRKPKPGDSLTLEDRREIVHRACRVLGHNETADFSRMCLGLVTKRLRNGATRDELLLVIDYARKVWDRGESRYSGWLNPLWLWSPRHFGEMLAAAQQDTGDKRKSRKDPMLHFGNEEWQRGLQERARKLR